MSSPAAGNEYVSFVELMRLETIDDVTYRSTAQPFCPGGNIVNSMGRAYGGHVYAQAAWAAAQTLPEGGFVLHNITGWFILPGLLDVPFVYKVHNIRDGRSYCTRIVNVTQASGKGVCFTCTCSFKTEESSELDAQESIDLWQKYNSVLQSKTPDNFPEAPGMDVPRYHNLLKNGHPNDKFPGLTMKRVDMSAFNDPREPLDRRQLIFYKPIGELPPDFNLHMCAHLYASDRNSLFIVANHLGVGGSFSQMGSLTHTVTFHAPLSDLRLEKAPILCVKASSGVEGDRESAYDHLPVRHEITSVWTGRSFQSSESQAAACSSHSHRSPQPFPSVALTKHSSTTRTALFCFIRHHLRHERLYHSAHPLRPKPTHSNPPHLQDTTMGAWGFNFFESDHDFDTVSDLSHEAGLDALESKTKERARQKQSQSGNENATKPDGPTGTDEDDDYPLLSIYAGACADVDLVREHLDGGALRKLIDEKKAKMEKSDNDDKYAELGRAFGVYEFVLLGACAMTLGCKIPDDFKELLIEKYRTTELQRDSLHAMQLALGDGPDRYKETPYDFGSKGLIETANSHDSEEDEESDLPYVGLNVSAPFGLFSNPKAVPLKEYPVGVCGGCGAKDRLDGQPLLGCGKCKTKKYCGKVCQQAHFEQHKRVCKPQ